MYCSRSIVMLVLLSRLSIYVNKTIGEFQREFLRNRAITDKGYTIQQDTMHHWQFSKSIKVFKNFYM